MTLVVSKTVVTWLLIGWIAWQQGLQQFKSYDWKSLLIGMMYNIPMLKSLLVNKNFLK